MHLKYQIFKINIYFYFIVTSIITPPIFFILSNKLVSIYHFLGVLIFSLIFYLILSVYFILSQKLIKKMESKNRNMFQFLLIIIIFFSNIYISKSFLDKNKDQINDTQYINELIINNNLINSNKKLFTNDLHIINLWLFK